MNNKTFETIQKTVARLTSCVEVDRDLGVYQKAEIQDVIELLSRLIDEATNPTDTP
jgi:hypothetical protein